jgi:hypothetical protein
MHLDLDTVLAGLLHGALKNGVSYEELEAQFGAPLLERGARAIRLSALGEDFVAKNTVLISLINANSPMTYDDTMLGALKVYVRHNQAVIVTPFIMAGAMAPITMAAAIAQQNAEALAGIALTQLVRPGAPVLYGGFTTTVDMKSGSPAGEEAAVNAIAQTVVDQMQPGRLVILGPGTTTRAITDRLDLPKTLIGVDVLLDGRIIAADANEQDLLALLDQHSAQIIITPIGGQGYLFGRGNQQISPAVIRRVGLQNILVISAPQKIVALGGRPLLVDSGDTAVDQQLAGYTRVITGYNEQMVYKVSS